MRLFGMPYSAEFCLDDELVEVALRGGIGDFEQLFDVVVFDAAFFGGELEDFFEARLFAETQGFERFPETSGYGEDCRCCRGGRGGRGGHRGYGGLFCGFGKRG